MSDIVLASLSPYRAQLLKQVGLKFKVAAPEVDEEELKKQYHGPQNQLAEFLSLKKAQSLKAQYPESILIGSDQVLLYKDVVLSKPKNENEVTERLSMLQGQTHTLLTAVSVLSPQLEKTWTTQAQMTMYPLNLDQIKNYYEKDKAIGCAGGYKIEGHGPLLFEKIKTDDYFSIIGLPLLSLIALLRQIDPRLL